MAAQVALIKLTYDGGSQVDALNLYANAAGYAVAHGGWATKVMSPNDKECAEAMTLIVRGTTHDDLATKLQNLAAKVLEIQQHADDVATQQNVWLKVQLTDETAARMAFISEARVNIQDSLMGPPVSPGNFLSKCQLALVRGHWERDAAVTVTSANVDSIGGSDAYATVVGDIPARIRSLQFQGDVSGGGPMYEFWMGFRTARLGTPVNFVPVWEAEDGTVDGADTSIDSSSEVNTASPGSGSGAYVETTFNTQSGLVRRFVIEVNDVTANYGDHRGTFAVLMRAKVGASTVCRARIREGFKSAANWETKDRVTVSSTGWFIQSLGTVTIPPTRGFPTSSDIMNYTLRFEAERVSGSGSLMVDCLLLVPISEGFVHLTGGNVLQAGADVRYAEVLMFPDGAIAGNAWENSNPIATLDIDIQRYGLPVGTGTLFMVAQRETQSYLADYCDIQIKYIPRWLTLRGSE